MSPVDTIATVSYIDVQVYECVIGPQFQTIPDTTSLFQTYQFVKILSHEFLCVLTGIPTISDTYISLASADSALFKNLKVDHLKIKCGIKCFQKRKTQGGLLEDKDM